MISLLQYSLEVVFPVPLNSCGLHGNKKLMRISLTYGGDDGGWSGQREEKGSAHIVHGSHIQLGDLRYTLELKQSITIRSNLVPLPPPHTHTPHQNRRSLHIKSYVHTMQHLMLKQSSIACYSTSMKKVVRIANIRPFSSSYC